jgi:hypothetical protein
MTPAQLTLKSFDSYPPQARTLASAHLSALQVLPLSFLVVTLRDVITYDWKLPAERERISRQLDYLAALPPASLTQLMHGFAFLQVAPSLDHQDWVADPAAALEKMTAYLWSSHQMDAFRNTAEDYSNQIGNALPQRLPSQPRLGIVLLGQGVADPASPLFRKLRPHGVYLRGVQDPNALPILLAEVERRAALPNPAGSAFRHWYIDGGHAAPASNLTSISYAALEPARQALLQRTQKAIESDGMGPERLRTLLARLRPEDIGLGSGQPPTDTSAALNYFQVSLLTEGSGTQIFSTTFVQWAARECLRRAEPETVLLRYAPRQQQQSMNVMLSGQKVSGLDPQGSLVDADMGAYYTWLNMRRLTGADQMRFLVYFEGHNQALAIAPTLPGGTTSDTPMDMARVLKLLA